MYNRAEPKHWRGQIELQQIVLRLKPSNHYWREDFTLFGEDTEDSVLLIASELFHKWHLMCFANATAS